MQRLQDGAFTRPQTERFQVVSGSLQKDPFENARNYHLKLNVCSSSGFSNPIPSTIPAIFS
jgi:hypothetical protein